MSCRVLHEQIVAHASRACIFICVVTPTRKRRGRNTYGQLGAGDSDDRLDGSGLELVTVDLDGSVATAIAAGEGHACALLDDASVKCW